MSDYRAAAEMIARLTEERDAAIRERDEARREAWPAIRKEADDNLLRWRAAEERAEKAIRERDEARSEVKTQRLLVESQTEQISRSAMDLYAAVQAEVATKERAEKAERERDEARATKDMHKERQEDLEITVLMERERAEKAEGLLREVLTLSKCPAGASCSCCAAIRTTLLAKIREALGAK